MANAVRATPARLDRVGTAAMSAFAFLWALTGASALRGATASSIIALASVLTAAAAWLADRRRDATSAPANLPDDWSRRFNRIGGIQAVAILGAVVVLGRLQEPGYIPSAVCAIVAMHFLPLARLFGQTRFRWTAGALLVVAAAGSGVAHVAGGEPARAAVGFGAAAVLWSSAATAGARLTLRAGSWQLPSSRRYRSRTAPGD